MTTRSFVSFILPVSVVIVLNACRSSVPVADIEQIPEVTEVDRQYKGIYAKLDGTWQGTFTIYRASQEADPDDYRSAEKIKQYISDRQPAQTESISVTQQYESLTPYFQKVVITDRYRENGIKKTVVSEGVNKVQNGQLYCVVKKPSETVVHRGSIPEKNAIVWQRDLKNPVKKEFFYETVSGEVYEIYGWGIYNKERNIQYFYHGRYFKE